MLSLGKKNARRCTECEITCHAACAHLVPDLCGMSMETASELLRVLKEIKRSRRPSNTYHDSYGGVYGENSNLGRGVVGSYESLESTTTTLALGVRSIRTTRSADDISIVSSTKTLVLPEATGKSDM